MKLVFSPIMGWPATLAVVAGLLALTVILAARAHAQAPDVDSSASTWARRGAISLVVCVLLIGPATATSSMTRAVSATDVVIAVDITGSMAVQDATYPGSGESPVTRITAARHAVEQIVEMYPASSFTAVSFGASTVLGLPLTPDTYAVTSWMDNLVTEPTGASYGSNLSGAMDGLTNVLSEVRAQHANDTIVLYYISDGEQTSDDQRESFSALRAYLNAAVVVGVGSDEGGKVPYLTGGLRAGDTLPDDQTWVSDPTTGADGVSKRDSATLSQIADELSGSYQALDSRTDVSYPRQGEQSSDYRMTTVDMPAENTNPIVWPFALILAALLLWEYVDHIRTTRRLL